MAWIYCFSVLSLLFVINSSLSGPKNGTEKQVVKILLFDKTQGYLNWGYKWFKNAAETKCSTRCIISEDRNTLQDADLVIFHAPTHYQVPSKRPLKAIYAMFSMEQPKYATFLSDTQYLTKHFQLLATYSHSERYPGTHIPNLPLTYFPLNILSPSAVLQPSRPFADKTGYNSKVSVAIFTSNCHAAGASQRFKYVEELARLIPIHSYGKCHKNIDEPKMADDPRWPAPAQRRARKVKILSYYKFYLAFENLEVDDYVSEKVFEGLFAGTVPIYRGAQQIANFMPSNDSFINANEMFPAQLAVLLHELENDEKRYSRYLAFKRAPLSERFQEMALRSYTHPNVLCRLCEFAQRNPVVAAA